MFHFKNFELRRLLFGSLLLAITIWPTVVRGQLLQNGEETLSSISAGASATFEFNVDDAGGTVFITVGETDSFAQPLLEVFDPNGNLIASDNGFSDAVVQFSPPQAGRYSAVVSDNGNNESMQFRIRLLVVAEDATLIGGRDVALTNGQESLSSIPLGTFAVFPFQVNFPGAVVASVGERISFTAEPKIEIFDPNGNLVIRDVSSGSDALVDFTPSQIGRYTAVVSDNGNNESMQFRIRLLAVAEETSLIGGRDAAFENGQESLSSIPLGSFAVFPFQADSTSVVIASVGETDGTFAEPVLRIFNPNGILVASDNGNSDALVEFTPSQTGRYTAVVSDNGNDESMQFRSRILVATKETTLIGGRDAALANGQESLSSIPPGTFAVFPFQAISGGVVDASIAERDSFFAEPRIQIFDPDGVLVASNNGLTSAVVEFTPSQTGRYTAVVSDNGNDESMQFNIVATGISDFLPPVLGDCDLNGVVNFLDISPFISFLSSGMFLAEADTNEDGSVNFLDISPFIAILSGS